MKNFDRKLKIWEAAALMALCAALLLGTWAQARQNAISAELVRLHVIAVSDDENEQKLKLRVRDEVLAYLRPLLTEAGSREEAEKIIALNLEGIRETAVSVSEGRQVRVSLGRENYPTKKYLGFSLPAGNYDSLRIILGEGKGKNWWCIVFPPLCMEAAQAEKVQSVMSREDYKIVSGSQGYELKFRLVELWGELLSRSGSGNK